MTIKNVTVAGGGVLGSQIAFQTAYHGFQVTIFDLEVDKVKARIEKLAEIYAKFFNRSASELQTIANNVHYSPDLKAAVAQADLVIEALPEVLDIKRDFYQQLNQAAPQQTIFATNSSTLLPSDIADATGRPAQFLALHFANEIWAKNTAEIMGHAGTDSNVFDQLVQFAKDIGMVALPVHKEQAGYILNSLLVPFLNAGLSLYANDVADPQTIDKTWMVATGAPMGPFAIMDVIGLNTLMNVNQNMAKSGSKVANLISERLQKDFVETGRMGKAVGKGFYDYPNPAFKNPDFLK